MKTKPLAIPDGFPKDYPGQRSEFRKKHPLWEWVVGGFHPNKYGALEREFAAELSRRSKSLEVEWKDYPQYHETLHGLQKIFNELLWFADVVFIPDDPYCIIGQLVTGDLCEVEAIMAIEEEFGIEIGGEDLVPEMTMLDFVRLVESRKAEFAANKTG